MTSPEYLKLPLVHHACHSIVIVHTCMALKVTKVQVCQIEIQLHKFYILGLKSGQSKDQSNRVNSQTMPSAVCLRVLISAYTRKQNYQISVTSVGQIFQLFKNSKKTLLIFNKLYFVPESPPGKKNKKTKKPCIQKVNGIKHFFVSRHFHNK